MGNIENDYLLLMGSKGELQYEGSLEDCYLVKHMMRLKGFFYLWICKKETFNKLGIKYEQE